MNDDLISRQAAIDALKGLPTWWANEGGYYEEAQPQHIHNSLAWALYQVWKEITAEGGHDEH